MGAPVPNDARFKGPFKPMRFEATVEDCIVSQGEIPDGAPRRLLPRRTDVEAPDPAGDAAAC